MYESALLAEEFGCMDPPSKPELNPETLEPWNRKLLKSDPLD